MKLAALALVTTLGLAGAAHADRGLAGPAPQRAQRAELRQLLLERFDKNHDGRLEPRERRRAARVLRRIARKLTLDERRDGRPDRPDRRDRRTDDGNAVHRARGQAQRFDANRDGVVSPGEMPPDAARTLQPLDQNRDGWLDDSDQP